MEKFVRVQIMPDGSGHLRIGDYASHFYPSNTVQEAYADAAIINELHKKAVQEKLEEAAKKLEMSADELRLMCGEMTSGEMRLLKVVLGNRAESIRALSKKV